MKCIQCGTDNNLKDRTAHQGRCAKCNCPFAFEPTSMGTVKITDPFFAKAITDISANNTLFFTPKQFFYFLDKRLKFQAAKAGFLWFFFYFFFSIWAPGFVGGFLSIVLGSSSFIVVWFVLNMIFIIRFFRASKSRKLNYQQRQANARRLQITGGLVLCLGSVASIAVFDSFPIFLVSVLLGITSIYMGTRQQMHQAEIAEIFLFAESQFQDWLNRWRRSHAPITKMLSSPRQDTPATVNPDLSAYSFDRLVVCDSAIIAQLLIANNFHFENNCAILSITGYPQSIFNTTMQMLRRNPDLQVYILHDCSPRGLELLHRLRNSTNWFQNSNVMIFDIGLLPRQIIASHKVFVQTSEESAQAAKQMLPAIRQDLSIPELAWLEAGKFVELESFTPQKLIQVLNRGIAGSRNLDDDSSLILVGDSGMGSVYASDSFG